MGYIQAGEPTAELTVRELASRLSGQLSALIRAELALAKAELFARGRQAVMGGGLFGAAAVVGLGAYLAMIAAAITGIAVALPVWASALIVGGALAALAAALGAAGRSRMSRGTPPLQVTAGTVRRDFAELAGRNGHQQRGAQQQRIGQQDPDGRS